MVGTVSHSRRLIRLHPLLCLAFGCFPAVRSVLVFSALFSAVWSLVCSVLVLRLFSAVSLCRLIVIKLQFLFFLFLPLNGSFFLSAFCSCACRWRGSAPASPGLFASGGFDPVRSFQLFVLVLLYSAVRLLSVRLMSAVLSFGSAALWLSASYMAG